MNLVNEIQKNHRTFTNISKESTKIDVISLFLDLPNKRKNDHGS